MSTYAGRLLLPWVEAQGAWARDFAEEGRAVGPALGPAGPAGTCTLRTPGASVSICRMTARVTGVWVEPGHAGRSWRLVRAISSAGAVPVRPQASAGEPLELAVAGLDRRAALLRFQWLSEARRHLAPGEHLVPRFLVDAELATVAHRLHADGLLPTPHARDHHRRAADRLAGSIGPTELRSLVPQATAFRTPAFERALRRLLADLDRVSPTGSPASDAIRRAVQATGDPGALGRVDPLQCRSAAALTGRAPAPAHRPRPTVPATVPARPVPARGPFLAALVRADRRSQVAWLARCTGRSDAGAMFAEAAIDWLRMGWSARAGWSWMLADRPAGTAALERELGASAEHALQQLDALADPASFPSWAGDAELPVPAWAFAIDLGALVPPEI
jgi:hypothetical protein